MVWGYHHLRKHPYCTKWGRLVVECIFLKAHRIFPPQAPQFPHANKVLSCPTKILTSRNKMCLWEKRRRREFPCIFRFACLVVGKSSQKIFDGDSPYSRIRKESPNKHIQAVDKTMGFFSIGFFTIFQVKVPGSNDIRSLLTSSWNIAFFQDPEVIHRIPCSVLTTVCVEFRNFHWIILFTQNKKIDEKSSTLRILTRTPGLPIVDTTGFSKQVLLKPPWHPKHS